jgi:DNA-binding transcriptional LysR family regulator
MLIDPQNISIHGDWMELRLLRYFLVLAEERHFRRAAQRLSISQPPLSLAIRQLEESLGTKLFQRNSRNVELTVAGRALQSEATFLLRRVEEVRDFVRAVDDEKGGLLRVGFGGSTLYRGLPAIIRSFRKLHPGIELRLQELSSAEQIVALKRDEIDFGFINGLETPDGLDGFRFCREPLLACLPSGHPYATKRSVQLEKLAAEEFILFGRSASPAYFNSILEACQSSGFSPTVIHEVRHWVSVISAVAHGLGVALVPQAMTSAHIAGVVLLPLKGGNVFSETRCVWKADSDRYDAQKSFATLVQGHVAMNEDASGNAVRK